MTFFFLIWQFLYVVLFAVCCLPCGSLNISAQFWACYSCTSWLETSKSAWKVWLNSGKYIAWKLHSTYIFLADIFHVLFAFISFSVYFFPPLLWQLFCANEVALFFCCCCCCCSHSHSLSLSFSFSFCYNFSIVWLLSLPLTRLWQLAVAFWLSPSFVFRAFVGRALWSAAAAATVCHSHCVLHFY